ncbi:MAG: dihydroorotase, partial [Sedimentisphaerales bacterium]|nr:dihydroorotase [Sedimentisphaerales bacterium]
MSLLLIKNGRVIDPANKVDGNVDVLVRDGIVAEVGKVTTNADTVIDAAGLIVTPGLIDMHIHLREPGDEEEETIASGSAAAVAGGFTSVVCMPNTNPPIDNEATVDFIYRQAECAGKANVFAAGAITKGREGKELAEMGQMVRGGAVAFTDDGSGVQNPAVMLRALQYVSMFDKVIMQHCQDNTLAGQGCMNSGYRATVLGLPGIPVLAEELMLYRDIQLVKQTSARLHAQHISTAGSVKIIRQGKEQGINITAEVTPHHLLLTEHDCRGYDPNYKMNPPLRSEKDVAALRQAVADGTIDCLASDHAPHLQSEKELEFLLAPFGIISIDCALGLYAKALIETQTIDWPRMIEMMTANP